MPIVSLGLANFYAQLTNRETRAYITKKLDLLEKYADAATHHQDFATDRACATGNEIWHWNDWPRSKHTYIWYVR